MATVRLPRRDRAVAAAVAAGLVALLVWALVLALAVSPQAVADSALKVFGVAPPPPPPPPERPPPHRPSYRRAGAAAPPHLRSQASPIAAPPPVVLTPPPPPVVVAPVPFQGAQASQGAADVAGPGTGAGGEGEGTGSGGEGNGDGAGDVPPRQIGGRIRDQDYPRAASEAGADGTVGVRFVVGIDGRVARCQVARSSGNAALDETTCRLIMERYRFKPGHDARGRPFAATIVQNESWVFHRPPAEERDDDDRP